MNVSEQLLTLLARLARLTSDGSVRWERAGPDSVSLALEKGSISITCRDGDGEHPFLVSVRTADGVVVDEVESDGSGNGSSDIKTLYHSATRNASGADRVIADMLNELPDPDFPF